MPARAEIRRAESLREFLVDRLLNNPGTGEPTSALGSAIWKITQHREGRGHPAVVRVG